MTRIAILCHSTFGGSARIATQLAIQLARVHEVHLFSRTIPFGRWDDHSVHLHTLEDVPSDSLTHAQLHIDWTEDQFNRMVDAITQAALEHDLAFLHFHYGIPFAFIAVEVKRRLQAHNRQIFLIGTLHGTEVSAYADYVLRGQSLEHTLKQVDHLTTVSRDHARLAQERFNLDKPPTVIYNFLARFPAFPETVPERTPRITHISNFRPVKQPLFMAQVFASVREQIDAELWLIGEGQEMAPVKDFFSARGLEDSVRYWGLQNDVEKLLLQSDLLLMTSRAESFCLAGLEAMACGVPVVSSRVGGIPEVIQHGDSGLLFTDGDHATASAQILSLLNDPAQFQRLRHAAYRRAHAYDVRHILPAYLALYERRI